MQNHRRFAQRLIQGLTQGLTQGLAIALLLSACEGGGQSFLPLRRSPTSSQVSEMSPSSANWPAVAPEVIAQVQRALVNNPGFMTQFGPAQEEPLQDEPPQEAPEPTATETPAPEIVAIAIVDDYALVQWRGRAENLPLEGHALLRKQDGQPGNTWQILNPALGYTTFGTNATLLTALGLSVDQANQLLEAFWYAGASLEPEVAQPFEVCITLTATPNSQALVREIPTVASESIASAPENAEFVDSGEAETDSANRVGTLEHGTTVLVTSASADWLAIRAPLTGWIALHQTRVTCGNTPAEISQHLAIQAQRASHGNFQAIDTLVRYTLSNTDHHEQAEEAEEEAETASEILATIAANHPITLIQVLDQYGEDSRNQVLTELMAVISPEAQQTFADAIAQYSFDSAIAQSWRQVMGNRE